MSVFVGGAGSDAGGGVVDGDDDGGVRGAGYTVTGITRSIPRAPQGTLLVEGL